MYMDVMDITCTTTIDNDTEPNPTISESSSMAGKDKTDDKKSLSQKSIKKKRKYTPRKRKSKLIEKSDQTDNNIKAFETIANLNFQCNDNIHNSSLGDNSIGQNKIWNPFQMSLFLSMLQYRRNNILLSFPVSLFQFLYQNRVPYFIYIYRF